MERDTTAWCYYHMKTNITAIKQLYFKKPKKDILQVFILKRKFHCPLLHFACVCKYQVGKPFLINLNEHKSQQCMLKRRNKLEGQSLPSVSVIALRLNVCIKTLNFPMETQNSKGSPEIIISIELQAKYQGQSRKSSQRARTEAKSNLGVRA